MDNKLKNTTNNTLDFKSKLPPDTCAKLPLSADPPIRDEGTDNVPKKQSEVLVQPWEHFEHRKTMAKYVAIDPFKSLLGIPSRNVIIEKIRKYRDQSQKESKAYLSNSQSELKSTHGNGTFLWEINDSKIEQKICPQVKKLLALYEEDWLICKQKSEHLNSYISSYTIADDFNESPSYSFEIDRQEILKIATDLNIKETTATAKKSHIGNVFSRDGSSIDFEETDWDFVNTQNKKLYETARTKQPRYNLLKVSQETNATEHHQETPFKSLNSPYPEEIGRKILVDFRQLHFEIGATEPFFLTAFIMDGLQKKRLSESFDFHLSKPELMAKFTPHLPNDCARSCIFHTSFPNPEIYLVILIDKVLEGDPAIWGEKYQLNGKQSVAEVGFLNKLRNFRQTFAFTYVPLFRENMSLETGQSENGEIWIKSIYRMELEKPGIEEILELISNCSNRSTGTLKKLKLVDAHLKLKITEYDPAMQLDIIDTFLGPAFPRVDTPLSKAIQVAEIGSSATLSFFQDFVNQLTISPIELNFSKHPSKARNIACKVQFLSNQNKFQKNIVIMGRCEFQQYLAVSYHQKQPKFYDEVKIRLPLAIDEHQSVLFTFYHVSCKNKDETSDEAANYLGASVLHIYPNSKLITNGEYSLPVYVDPVENLSTASSLETAKTIDNKKPVFRVSVRCKSSLYCQDQHISRLLKLTEMDDDVIIMDTLKNLQDSPVNDLLSFLLVIFDFHFDMICSKKSETFKKFIFKSFALIVNKLSSEPFIMRSQALGIYAKFHFQVRPHWIEKKFPILFLNFWATFLEEMDPNSNTLNHPWFYFELLWKSLIQFMELGKPDAEISHGLQKLFDLMSDNIIRRGTSGVTLSKEWNHSMANFICRSFEYVDPMLLFDSITRHVRSLNDSKKEVFLLFKFDFLRAVLATEHFLALELPLSQYQQQHLDRISSLREFWKRHYLTGLLLYEVTWSISHDSSEVRSRGLDVLKELLLKLDLDPRFNESSLKSNISMMFFPFIVHICDYGETLSKETKIFSNNDLKTISLIFLHLLRSFNFTSLNRWIQKDPMVLFNFVNAVKASTHNLKYIGRITIEERLQQKGTLKADDAKKYIENIHKATLPGVSLRELRGTLRMNTPGGSANKSLENIGPKHQDKEVLKEIKLAGFMATESAAIAITLFDQLISEANRGKSLLEKASEILVTLMDVPQSKENFNFLCHSIRNCSVNNPSFFFKGKTPIPIQLFQLIVKFFFSSFKEIRKFAVALVFLWIKLNHQECKRNFSKMRVQITLGLSKIDFLDDKYVNQSLSLLKKYSAEDKTWNVDQAKSLSTICDNLCSIVSDRLKLKSLQDDPKMQADKLCKIAHSYQNTPDLRLRSLEELAALLSQNSQHVETCITYLHCAALVSEYLFRGSGAEEKEIRKIFDFSKIHPMVNERLYMGEEDEDGVCQGTEFTEKGLINYLQLAASHGMRCGLGEYSNEIFKFLIKIFEKNHDYRSLMECHSKLKEVFEDIIKLESVGKRTLGAYYRVAFFGAILKELDGVEFIYRVKPYTQLPEICESLQNDFGKRLNFELLRDSGKIDRSKLNPEKAYAQVTFVEPHLDASELKSRKTSFDQAKNLDWFVYETPYTSSGKSHGTVADQYKRKTYLKTISVLPWINARSKVIDRKEIDLSPLEVSIEAITDRASKLKKVMESKPPNPKNLQIVLQGSVRLQVNAGPLEIASTFLASGNASKYPMEQLKKLNAAFNSFLDQCDQALRLNKLLISHDQIEYQEDLELGFQDMKSKFAEFLTFENDRDDSSREQYQVSNVLSYFLDSKSNAEIHSFFRS